MNESNAMQLISNVCADFKGTLKDHQLVQEALVVIQNKVFPEPVPVEKEPETLKPDFDGNKTETEDSK